MVLCALEKTIPGRWVASAGSKGMGGVRGFVFFNRAAWESLTEKLTLE